MKTLLLISLLFLIGCAKETTIGRYYKVKDGFYKGCVGWAARHYNRNLECGKTMLRDLDCGNVTSGSEYFEDSNLEEVKKGVKIYE